MLPDAHKNAKAICHYLTSPLSVRYKHHGLNLTTLKRIPYKASFADHASQTKVYHCLETGRHHPFYSTTHKTNTHLASVLGKPTTGS
jgi:hypothetical protein